MGGKKNEMKFFMDYLSFPLDYCPSLWNVRLKRTGCLHICLTQLRILF